MNTEVSVIVRLVFPDRQRGEYEFDVPMHRDQLPSEFWRESDDHKQGVFERVGDTLDYHFREQITRKEAWERNIKCL